MLQMWLLVAISCLTFGALRAAIFWWRQKKELKPGAAHTYPLYIVSMQVISFRIRMATDERTRSELSHYIKNSMIKGLELLFIGICTLFINLELGSRECDMIPAPQRVRDIPFHRPCLIDCHWYFEEKQSGIECCAYQCLPSGVSSPYQNGRSIGCITTKR